MDSDSGIMTSGAPLTSAAANHHGPPPSYDSVVANDELYARRLAYRKYSQHELDETDVLMEERGQRSQSSGSSSSCYPMSLPLNLTCSETPTAQLHYCPYMYVNPHHPHNNHSHRHLPRLLPSNHHQHEQSAEETGPEVELTTTASSQGQELGVTNTDDNVTATTSSGNEAAAAVECYVATNNVVQLAEPGEGINSVAGTNDRDGTGTRAGATQQQPVVLSDSGQSIEGAASAGTVVTDATPLSTVIVQPPPEANNNDNANNAHRGPVTAAASVAGPSGTGDQILSPKQMVISGRLQRQRSCRLPPSSEPSSLDRTKPVQMMTLMTSPPPSCDCQDVHILSPRISAGSSLLASHLCQCQQMAQMACANALCHCTEEAYRLDMLCSNPARDETDPRYSWRHIMEDQHNNNNGGVAPLSGADTLCYFADNGGLRNGRTSRLGDDIANNNSLSAVSATNRCEIVQERANGHAINSLAGTSGSNVHQNRPDASDANNNNMNINNSEVEVEEDEGGIPPRPPVRTTSRSLQPTDVSCAQPTMPDDQESASDLNNNNINHGTGTSTMRDGEETMTTTSNSNSNNGRYCDPLLYENGLIRLDMSKIIDRTGLPTYEAALRLESSGYV